MVFFAIVGFTVVAVALVFAVITLTGSLTVEGADGLGVFWFAGIAALITAPLSFAYAVAHFGFDAL